MYSDKTEISLDCNTNRITNLPIGVFKKKHQHGSSTQDAIAKALATVQRTL